MAPERWVHARVKAHIWLALDREITRAGLPCEAAPDGMTVEIGDGTDYEPDALVNRGPPMPDDAIAAPNPVVIVEVLSPSTSSVDTGAKLADYFTLASVQHYLVVRPSRREIIHHRRLGDDIQTRVVRDGAIELDPPGICLALDRFMPPERGGPGHDRCSSAAAAAKPGRLAFAMPTRPGITRRPVLA